MLVRAGVPLEGVEVMVEGRSTRRGSKSPSLKPHQLCNGPSKLCQALALTKVMMKCVVCCVFIREMFGVDTIFSTIVQQSFFIAGLDEQVRFGSVRCVLDGGGCGGGSSGSWRRRKSV